MREAGVAPPEGMVGSIRLPLKLHKLELYRNRKKTENLVFKTRGRGQRIPKGSFQVLSLTVDPRP
jgi:hypothetical protein